eukprot:399629-Alexandrium_andersonii.AAC.1
MTSTDRIGAPELRRPVLNNGLTRVCRVNRGDRKSESATLLGSIAPARPREVEGATIQAPGARIPFAPEVLLRRNTGQGWAQGGSP